MQSNMEMTNPPDLDTRVQNYVKEWEKRASNELQSTKMELICCKPYDRPRLKQSIETLGGVLDLLQGRRTKKNTKNAMRKEITSLRLKLREAEEFQKKTAASCETLTKVNHDLKIQLRRQNKVALEFQRQNKELRHRIEELEKTCPSKCTRSHNLRPTRNHRTKN